MSVQALLFLENEDGCHAACREALAMAGFDVRSASSAAAALEMCRENGPFALVVVEVMLENHNGRTDILRRLRSLCPSTRALLVSTSNLDRLLAAGVLAPEEFRPYHTAFLRKPQPAAVLTGKILELFGNTTDHQGPFHLAA